VSYVEPDLLPNGDPNPKATGLVALVAQDAEGNWVDTGLFIRFRKLSPWPGSRILDRPFRPIIEACAWPAPGEGYSSIQIYLGNNPGKFLDSDYITGFAPYRLGGGCEVFNHYASVEDGGTGGIKSIGGGSVWLDGRATYSQFNLLNGHTIKEMEVRIPPLFLNYQP
jgi:hypothetical protein